MKKLNFEGKENVFGCSKGKVVKMREQGRKFEILGVTSKWYIVQLIA